MKILKSRDLREDFMCSIANVNGNSWFRMNEIENESTQILWKGFSKKSSISQDVILRYGK